MAVNAARTVTINLTGGVILDKILEAAENEASPGAVSVLELAAGANTILVPVATGVTVKAATIVPPANNDQSIALKGIAGDTGVTLSMTDPTSIAFEVAPASFVLTAGGIISGLRIFWT